MRGDTVEYLETGPPCVFQSQSLIQISAADPRKSLNGIE